MKTTLYGHLASATVMATRFTAAAIGCQVQP